MNALLDLPPALAPVADTVAAALDRVSARFAGQLASDLPAVGDLCTHVERYRGKMLRPTLLLLSGLAASSRPDALTDHHITLAAVCEMVHMATLVHDDVLDDAETRRRGLTVNRLHGNEPAVILGDYLIASAYHLCSQVPDHRPALAVGRAAMQVCTGELLQLHHRGDASVDEPTYTEIVSRKTGELTAVSCELGGWASGAASGQCDKLADFGRSLGIAFQIQDDLLDLEGDEAVVGKSTAKDLEKGKLTLPLIHHLVAAQPRERGRSLVLIESVQSGKLDAHEAARALRRGLGATASIDYARARAARHVESAKQRLAALPGTPAKSLLLHLADTVISRAF